jgi:2-amino-4-hydroxy-6-hydroxymethyldihydropteridine diphosphokinase
VFTATFTLSQMINEAFLLIGGNVGATNLYLRQAIALIEEHCGAVVQISKIYKTEAWGNTDQQDFLNQAVKINTNLSASALLKKVLEVEQLLGRKRHGKWQARTIDIDIIYFGNEIIDTQNLKVPHLHLHARAFVLIPLVEIAPNFIHPTLGKSNIQLLADCTDSLLVEIYTEQYSTY